MTNVRVGRVDQSDAWDAWTGPLFFFFLIALPALPLDKAEHLSLLRFLLLRVHFGCHKVDIPDHRAENREAEDDKE